MKREQKGKSTGEIIVSDLSGGVQSKTIPALSQNNQLLHCLNGVLGNKIGGIAGRHGSVLTNTTGKIVDNIGIYRNGDTRKYFIVASDGSNEVIYTVPNEDFSGALSAVLAGHFTDAVSVKSTTFATKEMFFNGVDTPKQWSSDTGFSDIVNAPVKGKYPEVFQQRLFVLSTDGFLHYSDVINSTGTGFSTDAWTNRGINPNDGQKPRALIRHRGRLVIFKEESIYRYDGANEPEPIINIGTHSDRGLVKTDNSIFFHHPTGIYQMSLGDPIIISRAVQKYLDGMSEDNWVNVVSGRDSDKVYFWIGDVTISSPLEWDYKAVYENVTLVYDFLLERWQVWTGWEIKVLLENTDNRVQFFVDTVGKITKIDKNRYNDNGKAIDFQALWHPIDYGVPRLPKTLELISLHGVGDFNLAVGSNFNKLENSSVMVDNSATIQAKISFKKLWIMASATYIETPPFIEQLFIGKANVRNK